MKIFLNAGCRAGKMDALNSTTVMELDLAPSHPMVIGEDYVGIEFA